MHQFFVLLCIISCANAHSWMSCPPSFVTTAGRGGTQDKPCETSGGGAIVTELQAGDRLKVGWTSNNHAGGYVRLSLVKYGNHWGSSNDVIENNFKRNVLKFVCYGHDGRKGPNSGDCNHPCNARPGCQYQSDSFDKERFDTTIGIPTNLQDGEYVLQAALLVGNGAKPYYSCAKLRITKGNPSMNCGKEQSPLTYDCVKTGGPALASNFLKVGSTPGPFCYHFDGRSGTTDDDIAQVPININCDPRLTCGNAIHAGVCSTDAPDIDRLVNGRGEKIMPGCNAWEVVPPAASSCSDGIMNRDESDIDCGGVFCKECPPIVPPGKYHGLIEQIAGLWPGGGNFELRVEVTKTIPEGHCWQLIVQYNYPVDISSVWGEGRKVKGNAENTIITFEKPNFWTANPKAGKVISIKFSASNAGDVEWTEKNIQPQPATTLYVTENISECSNKNE